MSVMMMMMMMMMMVMNDKCKKLNSLKQYVRTTCFSHKTKTANIKNVVLPSITSPKCQCDAKQYNLFDICCFSFVTKTSRPYTLF